ncbi:hypothetical protein HELRODRAFT_90647, partial [Helobdella robusta]|uniref:Uncharacterized protein n=1 Tax=Helobdella robusta TaxID=6412 RepID=T1G7T8_HELRO
CSGCGQTINDQYILRVHPDLEWHGSCLKCAECQQLLQEMNTCFVRGGRILCRQDYYKLYGVKCHGCHQGFHSNDLVMRSLDQAYHVTCFRCAECRKVLVPGDEYGVCGRSGRILCKADHEKFGGPHHHSIKLPSPTTSATTNHLNHHQHHHTLAQHHHLHHHHHNGSSSNSSSNTSHKTTRIRTVLNEKQLHTLRTCYNANPRPDALMKEQLVEMTGLSPRVIRVWFQNKRCKDKKKNVIVKQVCFCVVVDVVVVGGGVVVVVVVADDVYEADEDVGEDDGDNACDVFVVVVVLGGWWCRYCCCCCCYCCCCCCYCCCC